MPGSIKIDDGSGNYTILTNAGSLGSDKTITIPNTTGTLNLQSGSVLQTVLGTYSTNTIITSTSFQDTNLDATITPSSTSSKILVLVNHSTLSWAPAAIPWGYIQLLRGSTVLTNRSLGMKAYLHGDSNNYVSAPFQMMYLDAPSSTSALTYKTQAKYAGGGSGQIEVGYQNLMQHIILMEIGG